MQRSVPVVEFAVANDAGQQVQRVLINGQDWTGLFQRMDVRMESSDYVEPRAVVTLEFFAELHRGPSAQRLREAAEELRRMAEELDRK